MKKIRDEDVAPLWAAYRNGCTPEQKLDLRNRLATFYFPLVRYYAERVASTLPPSVDVDDLVSTGSFGLIDAIEKFDPDRGFQFKTYAASRIRGAMFDGMREDDWVARLVRLRKRRYDTAIATLRAELGHDPLDEEIRAKLKMSDEEYKTFLLDAKKETAIFSLNDETEDAESEGGSRMIDLVADERALEPAIESELRDYVSSLLSTMTAEERVVAVFHYLEGMPFREIGEEVGISESRICQIHAQMLRHIRRLLSV